MKDTNQIVSDKKIKVLEQSLNLEKIASLALAYILDIKNTKDSKSLGNKSTSLSFNQKINLLLDNESINREEKLILDSFMSLRNQFMHNLDIKSYKDAFDCVTGLENKIRKLYPENFSSNVELEESLEKSIDTLFLNGLKILASYSKGGANRKMQLEAEHKIYKALHKGTKESVDTPINELIDSIKKDEFDFRNKVALFENLEVLKVQILSSQILKLKY